MGWDIINILSCSAIPSSCFNKLDSFVLARSKRFCSDSSLIYRNPNSSCRMWTFLFVGIHAVKNMLQELFDFGGESRYFYSDSFWVATKSYIVRVFFSKLIENILIEKFKRSLRLRDDRFKFESNECRRHLLWSGPPNIASQVSPQQIRILLIHNLCALFITSKQLLSGQIISGWIWRLMNQY